MPQTTTSADMPQTTTSAWFLDGHKLPSARTSETACFKMSSDAPDYPESLTKSLSGWYLDSHPSNSGDGCSTSNDDQIHDLPQTTTSAWFLDGHKLPSARTPETACFKMSSA